MLFRFKPDFSHRPSEQELAKMKEQWGSFIGNIAISEKLVSTYRLGFEGKSIQSDLSVTDGVLIAEEKMISGNMVVKANSLEEASELAKDCPILKMGGTIEVRTITPMEP
ncbi:MAG: hypothetical protein KI790_15235 [Cyclobacteriaceae bacterium]|nr:hypothetical protein [Cyclobacteriaceae bacterium HetDA_MAG_MS6]